MGTIQEGEGEEEGEGEGEGEEEEEEEEEKEEEEENRRRKSQIISRKLDILFRMCHYQVSVQYEGETETCLEGSVII